VTLDDHDPDYGLICGLATIRTHIELSSMLLISALFADDENESVYSHTTLSFPSVSTCGVPDLIVGMSEDLIHFLTNA
jgi:hypothetical protein